MRIFKILTTAVGGIVLISTVFAQHDHSGGGSISNMNMNSNSNSNMNMNHNANMMMLPPKTETLKVWGKCDMCKARIEKIALTSGVTTADWSVKTKFLTVVYDPDKSSLNYISDKLA